LSNVRSSKANSSIFYVYVLLDTRRPGVFSYGRYMFTYEPFYVGKGHGDRCYSHFNGTQEANKLKVRKIAKIIREIDEYPKITIEAKNLTEEKAFAKEAALIKAIGRHDLRAGPLTNLTDGGDGGTGTIRTSALCKKQSERTKERYFFMSEEERAILSETLSKSISEVHAQMTPPQKKARSKAISVGLQNMSKKAKARRIKAMSIGVQNYFDRRTPEEKKEFRRMRKVSRNNWSKETEEAANKKRSKASKAIRANMSTKETTRFSKIWSTKRKEAWANKTNLERKIFSSKLSEARKREAGTYIEPLIQRKFRKQTEVDFHKQAMKLNLPKSWFLKSVGHQDNYLVVALDTTAAIDSILLHSKDTGRYLWVSPKVLRAHWEYKEFMI
jgi:hypothetical protein